MEKHRFGELELAHMEASPVPYAVYQFIDKRVVTLTLTDGFLKLFELERDEAYDLMDNNMYRDTHPDDAGRIADAAFRFATEQAGYNVVYRTKVSSGYRIVRARGEHVYLEDGTRLAYVWYTDEGLGSNESDAFEGDIGKAVEQLLHEEARYQQRFYDRLTGLPNMTYFYELAEASRARFAEEGTQAAFLFFNLNGMKHFNHKYGFDEGDVLITSFAKALVRHFGAENCSRFGKDHFSVLTGADNLEDELQDLFDECEGINGGNSLPVSVGIYLDQDVSMDAGDACDRAQYACSLTGDSYVSEYRRFDESMLVEVEDKRYIVENIDRAIEERWIQVHYQAIVRAASGQVCDEEALSRWVDPQRGLLSPDKFIPALEDAKLIYKLDLYVIEQVLAKMKQQAEESLYVVPQSVNLSRADFDALDIVEEIRWRVDAAGIPHDKLNIEITESMVGRDFEFMKQQVERFQELGFNVWMDDFGTGYSSLDVLQSIPFDVIKLDMHFLRGFDDGDKSKIILTELVRMAIGLDIDTVAEGVETEEQAEFLMEIGCSRLQGFLYSKPVPLDTIVERKKAGTLIGFENPDETDYYATIGKVNLYDMAVIAQDDEQSFERYFDTIPMAIYEMGRDEYHIARTNKSYRDFMKRTFDVTMQRTGLSLPQPDPGLVDTFMTALQQCASNGSTQVVYEETNRGETTHSIIKRIAVNPITGACALVVAILAVVDSEDHRPVAARGD